MTTETVHETSGSAEFAREKTWIVRRLEGAAMTK
jgi:hypothetical protein